MQNIKTYQKDFIRSEKIWLNAASEGPLPIRAAQALKQAVEWKSMPDKLTLEKFSAVPLGLKKSVGRLIGVDYRDVILANSASYGLHILADGIDWQPGDEIIVMQNDFPTDILPWLALEEKGVKVLQIAPKDNVLTPEELSAAVSDKTKLFCIAHVHSFSGFVLDVERFAEICQEKGILFVLNISQSVGTRPINISEYPVDAIVSVGYKWLCGPYGTGFCWIARALRDRLRLNKAYWVSFLNDSELQNDGPLQHKDVKSAKKYDVFGTANFFNFVPFTESINYFLDIGLEAVEAHNSVLIDHLIDTLDSRMYEFISPREGRRRSALCVFSHKNAANNLNIYRCLLEEGIYTAFWRDNIRVSPHVYNVYQDIDRLVSVLNGWC